MRITRLLALVTLPVAATCVDGPTTPEVDFDPELAIGGIPGRPENPGPPPGRGMPSTIVYVHFEGQEADLYLMDGDGSNQRPLLAGPEGYDHIPDLSPDGREVVFLSRRAGTSGALFIVGTDGTGLRQLTFTAGFDTNAQWSPDGSRIAFMRADPSGTFLSGIWVINADGTGETQLTPYAWKDNTPRWLNDDELVFTSDRSGNRDVWRLSLADPANPVQLTTDPGYDEATDVARGGRSVTFHSNRAGVFQVFTMDADGSNVRQITSAAEPSFSPVFSPDGLRVAFHRTVAGNRDVYSVGANGGDLRNLTNAPGTQGWISWSRAAR